MFGLLESKLLHTQNSTPVLDDGALFSPASMNILKILVHHSNLFYDRAIKGRSRAQEESKLEDAVSPRRKTRNITALSVPYLEAKGVQAPKDVIQWRCINEWIVLWHRDGAGHRYDWCC